MLKTEAGKTCTNGFQTSVLSASGWCIQGESWFPQWLQADHTFIPYSANYTNSGEDIISTKPKAEIKSYNSPLMITNNVNVLSTVMIAINTLR